MEKVGKPKKENSPPERDTPYFTEKTGNLLEYLRSREDASIDNLFFGHTYFQKIVDLGVILPGVTTVRVDRSPAPDTLYTINAQNLLESFGQGEYNMSAVSAPKGTSIPEDVLKNCSWSISGLKLYEE